MIISYIDLYIVRQSAVQWNSAMRILYSKPAQPWPTSARGLPRW